MIRYGNPQEVEEYFADDSINQSYLKELIKGVEYLGKKESVLYYEEKGHFKIGSAVDVWLTQGTINFNKQYYVSEGQKPSDAIISMVHMVFDNNVINEIPTGGALMEFRSDILDALDFHKYQSRWKEETRIQRVIDEGSSYFEELKEAHGKTILTNTESTIIHNIVMSLQSSKHTNKYFKDSPTVDIFYQLPVYFTYQEMSCKALLDMVIIDHENKQVFPIDIKTMGDFTRHFPWAVKGRGYNFQAAFYTEALMQLKLSNGGTIKGFPDISEYEIMPFKFIVETTKFWKNTLTDETTYYQGKPLVYKLSRRQMRIGKFGRPELTVPTIMTRSLISETYPTYQKEVIGFKGALELHTWHLENGFEQDREVVVNNGVLLIE